MTNNMCRWLLNNDEGIVCAKSFYAGKHLANHMEKEHVRSISFRLSSVMVGVCPSCSLSYCTCTKEEI